MITVRCTFRDSALKSVCYTYLGALHPRLKPQSKISGQILEYAEPDVKNVTGYLLLEILPCSTLRMQIEPDFYYKYYGTLHVRSKVQSTAILVEK